MNTAYELFQKQAEENKQLYTLLRFACKCDHVAAFVKNTEAAIVFLAARNKNIDIFNCGDVPLNFEKLDPILSTLELTMTVANGYSSFEKTELLYIDSISEGNIKAMELTNYGNRASKYILIPKTVKYAHNPEENISVPLEKKIGIVFGINHFIMNNDDWFILEHDDVDPGMTVLINRKNVDAY